MINNWVCYPKLHVFIKGLIRILPIMITHEIDDFEPPTVPQPTPIHTYSNYSNIPCNIKKRVNIDNNDEPPRIIIGIDEAGRGPIIGPMVYSAAYCSVEFGKNILPKCEFADSKKLTEPKRWELMKRICDFEVEDLSSNLGYAITSLTALDISSCMLRPSNLVINLNEQAHSATIELIKGIIKKLKQEVSENVIIEGVYIDTVGPPASYTKKLRQFFSVDDIRDIRVEKKADATYPIVSAASVVAKVTRDWFIECSSKEASANSEEPENWGSGYPSDPRTSYWINNKLDPWFGWDLNIRYSWGTAKDAMTKSKISIEMRWEHEIVKKHGFDDVAGLLSNTGNTSTDKFQVDRDWFVL